MYTTLFYIPGIPGYKYYFYGLLKITFVLPICINKDIMLFIIMYVLLTDLGI